MGEVVGCCVSIGRMRLFAPSIGGEICYVIKLKSSSYVTSYEAVSLFPWRLSLSLLLLFQLNAIYLRRA